MREFLTSMLFLSPAIICVIYGLAWKRTSISFWQNWLASSGLLMALIMFMVDAVALGTLLVTGSAQTLNVFLSLWVLIPITFVGSLPALAFSRLEEPMAMVMLNIFSSTLIGCAYWAIL